MKKTDIFPTWGTTYELDNGLDFFQQSSDFWREELYKENLLFSSELNLVETTLFALVPILEKYGNSMST